MCVIDEIAAGDEGYRLMFFLLKLGSRVVASWNPDIIMDLFCFEILKRCQMQETFFSYSCAQFLEL